MAGLVALLDRDGSDTAGRETSGAGSNEFGEAADEFQFRLGCRNAELVLEELACLGQVLEGVFFHQGEEGGVQGVGFAELVDFLAFQDVNFLVVVQVDEDEAKELAEVETCDHFFEGLLIWTGRVFVDYDIIGGTGENYVLVIERAPFAINGH